MIPNAVGFPISQNQHRHAKFKYVHMQMRFVALLDDIWSVSQAKLSVALVEMEYSLLLCMTHLYLCFVVPGGLF